LVLRVLASYTLRKTHSGHFCRLETSPQGEVRRANVEAAMPSILKNERSRLAFRFGHQSGIRATCETLEQLQAKNAELKRKLAAERAHNVQ
jgi:hypothetical protein